MSWYRRSTAPGLKGGRRRSSVSYSVATGRRCSLSTFAASSRARSGSKGHIGRDLGEDDIESCQPPVEELPQVAGYEDVTFEPSIVPPPTLPIITEAESSDEGTDMELFTKVPVVSESEARELLIRYANSRCVLDKDAARYMKITKLDYQPGYKYTLESFTESRQVNWSFEPYTGGPLDETNAASPPPDPWSVECSNPQPFQAHILTVDVPHTDVLMTCHACGGVGSKRCSACSAAGWQRCSFCLGDGHKTSLQGHRERCFRCLGTGRKKCWKCGGETIAMCRGCSGTGQIRCFISITITWTTHKDTHVIEPRQATVIGSRLENAQGYLVFEDEKPLIFPVVFPDGDLQSAANHYIEKHMTSFSTEKIILQRHGVYTIPVYCITYVWRQEHFRYFIFGSQKEVFAPDYPENLCCCSIS